MFAFGILQALQKKHSIELYSQNNKPANHADITESSASQRVVLRGPVRNFAVGEIDKGNEHIGYRFITPPDLLEKFDYKAICQTRDVLDLCVSQYFSQGWIHPPKDGFKKRRKEIQAGKITLFEYCLLEFEGKSGFGQDSILSKYRDLKELENRLGRNNVLRVNYEDMVERYPVWAKEIIDFLEPILEVGSILEDLRPEYKNICKATKFYADPLEYVAEYKEYLTHIRSPYPGDHKNFLTEKQIEELRQRAQDILG